MHVFYQSALLKPTQIRGNQLCASGVGKRLLKRIKVRSECLLGINYTQLCYRGKSKHAPSRGIRNRPSRLGVVGGANAKHTRGPRLNGDNLIPSIYSGTTLPPTVT